MTNIIDNKHFAIIPSRNFVLYPDRSLPLSITRAQSVLAVKKALATEDRLLVVVAQKDELGQEEADPKNLYKVGTLARIEKVFGQTEGSKDAATYQLVIRGLRRVSVQDYQVHDGVIEATIEYMDDIIDGDEETRKALARSIKDLGKEILELVPAETKQLVELLEAIDDLSLLISLCAENLDVPLERKQSVLETLGIKARALLLLEFMQGQKEALVLQGKIRDRLSQKMGKMQREAILREQMNAIREELGDDKSGQVKDDYVQKINKANLPEEAKKVALEEAQRLEAIGPQSPESHIIRNYLDLILALPWSQSSEDLLDLDAARKTLNDDHFGLEKIKKRIVQHLAVMKLKKDHRGSILLFIGPPGVGKTSLGESIARALGRKFVRISLGGVRDEAEVRGHRRTYIGAMPGRIIQGMKRAAVNNPVFLLDEVDKMGRGFAGDPAGAMLEVLDPEQNHNFSDHFLDIPFDLSKVFFIATANSLEGIPGPLLDRMEVINLSGYTIAEKIHIAKNHLVPKQFKEHGLTSDQLVISDAALMQVITTYTREAGVRDLQRHIQMICRAVSEKILDSKTELPLVVQSEMLNDLIGPERFTHEVAERIAAPGVVTGLAWTPMGGEILFIEATQMPGSGKLILTGQLGDVMKESAQIALSLVRSHLSAYVSGSDFEKKDLHIHVPAGAVPKDGPSAGVTMLVTIASLFTGRSVNPKLAMTGEITLRGVVNPVGGIKEKVIAAHRAGVEQVILPKRNEKDLIDVPEEIRQQLKIHFAETVADLMRIALGVEVASFAPFVPHVSGTEIKGSKSSNSSPQAPWLS